ncbi:zinc finger BED domain-containing protein RICESLEEPER 2-like [Mercurialis annua]|uniref:zinc finger BED domain-containing protein RICESLEEPER 2-like n=1 Tax=Mercurialis annua TaxID=3986 RepID=UPI0024AE31E4|nr:zinc finger BED domain-containing protein RICESLEEPER 2-like [Mercurialis annua]
MFQWLKFVGIKGFGGSPNLHYSKMDTDSDPAIDLNSEIDLEAITGQLPVVQETAPDGNGGQSPVEANAVTNPDHAGGSGPSGGQNNPVEANTRKRKEVHQRSIVWDHFNAIKDADGVIIQAKCSYCARIYNCHAKKMPAVNVGVVPNSGPQMCNVANWKFDQEAIRKAVSYMIVVDELPLKFVEKQGFKKLMSIACPRFKIPSRWTVNRDCYAMFVEEKLKLKHFMKFNTQRVSLTSDAWTSNQRINYMCVTAHFIDTEWKLHKKIISFVPCSRHKGEYLSKALETCLQEWGLKNIFTVTLDNAENNTAAMSFFMKKMLTWGCSPARCKFAHMRCIAHILNLVVSDGLKESGASVQKVRGVVRYIKNSPLRLSKFKECKKTCELECKRSLCLDVPTRWNSTYLMLNTACLYQKVFEEYEETESSFKKDLGDSVPGFLDWEHVRELCGMLECFYKMTLRISGSLYVTSNNHFNEISDLCTILQDWTRSDDVSLRSMGSKMKQKFDKYWGDPIVMNKLIFFANILDPRDRILYLEYTLTHMYGVQEGKFLFSGLMDDLLALFNDYELQHKKEKAIGGGQTSVSSEHVGGLSQANSVLKERYLQEMKETGGVGGTKKSELDLYLGEAVVANEENFDILRWWKLNSERLPVLSKMARDILAVPVSTVASESAFSTGGRVLDDFRSSLTPTLVEALICTQDWLKDPTKPVSVEESLDELEQFEEGLTCEGNFEAVQACFDLKLTDLGYIFGEYFVHPLTVEEQLEQVQIADKSPMSPTLVWIVMGSLASTPFVTPTGRLTVFAGGGSLVSSFSFPGGKQIQSRGSIALRLSINEWWW